MELLAVFIACGCAAGLLLAARLVSLRMENAITGWALAGFIFCLSAFALDSAAYQAGWFEHFPHLWAVANPFIIALFPCLFLYVASIATPEIRWRPIHFVHFAPTLLFAFADIQTYMLSGAEKAALAREQLQNAHNAPEFLPLLFIDAYGFLYLAACWRTFVLGRRQRMREQDLEGLAHVRHLELSLLPVTVLLVLGNVLDFTPWGFECGFAISIFAAFCAFWALWELINPHSLLVLPPKESVTDKSVQAPVAPSVETSGDPTPELSNTEPAAIEVLPVSSTDSEKTKSKNKETVWQKGEMQLLRQRLDQVLLKDKLFLDPQLSLPTLASKVHSSRHKMSAAIKAIFGQNFYQLIGSLRVREAARVMASNEGYGRNVSEIAFSVGFNSLSTFNTAFKAEFGQTPSNYIAQNAVKRSARKAV